MQGERGDDLQLESSQALPEAPEHSFPLQTQATPPQQKAFDLLEVDPA